MKSLVDQALDEVAAAYPGSAGKNHTIRILADGLKEVRKELSQARTAVLEVLRDLENLTAARRERDSARGELEALWSVVTELRTSGLIPKSYHKKLDKLVIRPSDDVLRIVRRLRASSEQCRSDGYEQIADAFLLEASRIEKEMAL
jgi:hypothetical protein